MTRTVWGTFKAPDVSRIVIHTFGSEIDTVLAVYRGTEIPNLRRVTANDNRTLAGFGSTSSLMQFNTVKDANYAVQIGSRRQAEGDISLNVFRFPPGGGLAAFLVQYNGFPFNGKDHSCELFETASSVFCDAKFIVHNSTNKTLTVTSSTTLGTGVTGPAPFSLAAGALKVVTFAFNATTFNKTVRTVSGHFIFTGRVGSADVTETKTRSTVAVRAQTTIQDLVRTSVAPTIRTGRDNEPILFDATITNTGAVTAIGCHFRSTLYGDLKTAFYRIDPATKERLSADDVPLNIPAGQQRSFKVSLASQSARDASNYDFPEVIADCANNNRRASPLTGASTSARGVAQFRCRRST